MLREKELGVGGFRGFVWCALELGDLACVRSTFNSCKTPSVLKN